MDYQIFPPEEIQAEIQLPLSKSISNRVLIINALTDNKGRVEGVAKCDDSDVMREALTTAFDSENDCGTINIGAAGTAMRFLTAYFAVAKPGRTVVLDGSERMRQRPIKALVAALNECGGSIAYAGKEGYPPLKIEGKRLKGGSITLDGSVSSQYVSALLMAAPYMELGLTLTLTGEVVSRPYIDMTLSIMREWGVDSEVLGNTIKIPAGSYKPIEYKVEADWSAASYWFEIGAFSFGDIKLDGLMKKSLQGDSRVAEYFKSFGIESEWDSAEGLELSASPDITPRFIADLSEQPDLAQTLVVTCCALNIPFRISGLSTLKIKETDRLNALCVELRKLSFLIECEDDSVLSWNGQRVPVAMEEVAIDTYKDHRMAMAFAPVAFFLPGLIIRDAGVVAKSYPGFWDDMRHCGFTINEVNEVNQD
ncbi:MAG: 3-phosphoshikimate 1-carboxyvinyltransferase [Lachnospiraceae bacterium]|nr:3-phosphoshikimate 1-carboxyvinyltransferase [Lachnospiraceae bacterium]